MRTTGIIAFLLLSAAISYFFMLSLNASIPTDGPEEFWRFLALPFSDRSFREHAICKLGLPFSEVFFILAFAASLFWALRLYTGLRQQDARNRAFENAVISKAPKNPLGTIKSQAAPSTTGLGRINASNQPVGTEPTAETLPIFFIAWHWSARHFRAHWHNFILNAYRHRALWRYEEIQRKLLSLAAGIDMASGEGYSGLQPTIEKIRENVAETLLELYRLSGVLLLLPGQSSYLEAGSDERATEQLVKLEEIVKSVTTGRSSKSG